MSEELFIRGIVSLFISVLVFLGVEHRYDEEMEWKNNSVKKQRYLPYVSTGFLIGGLLGKVILGLWSDVDAFEFSIYFIKRFFVASKTNWNDIHTKELCRTDFKHGW